jgi:hypothetical protein
MINESVRESAPNFKKSPLTIKPPNFQRASFRIKGLPGVPLVIHRKSAKFKAEFIQKMEGTLNTKGKRNREPKDTNVTYEECRYRAKDGGWDGFHAGALRNALISACRLVNFKMTLAKLSIFIVADGVDELEPQIPLVRIYGEPVKQEDWANVETGQPYVTVRPAFFNWYANVTVRWDADQFSLEDVINLLSRVGLQVGLCEGRPDSKNSAGMGWGLFEVEGSV